MLNINKKISSYNNSSRNGNSIKYIVLHYTGNKGDTAKNNVDYFYGGNRSASAHYFVDDNSIWQSVEDSRSAWAVGDGRGTYGITNQNSISIEMCCQSNGIISDITENNALQLTKYLINKYGLTADRVVRHYDASRKICPNWNGNNWSRWITFKSKLNGTSTNNVSNANTTNYTVRDFQAAYNNQYNRSIAVDNIIGNETEQAMKNVLLKEGSKGDLVAYVQIRVNTSYDGIFGPNTKDAVIKYQKEHNLDSDGIVGYNTIKTIINQYK